jgi:diguanylate cyclase (GGDEF)-like protein
VFHVPTNKLERKIGGMANFNLLTGKCQSKICRDQEFNREQHRMMVKNLPLVYALIFVTTLIAVLSFDTGAPKSISVYMPSVLLGICGFRFFHWSINPKKFASYDMKQVRKDLRFIVILTSALAVGFSVLGVLSFYEGTQTGSIPMVFFIWTIALAVSFSLSALPVVSIMVILIVSVPNFIVLTLSGNPMHQALASIFGTLSIFFALMVSGIFQSFRDLVISKSRISEKNELLELARQQAENAAATDVLTGLPNRRRFGELVENTICNTENERETFVVGLIEIEGLKHVSDLIGHAGRDRVVKRVADRIVATLSEDAIVARYRSNEFAVLINNAGRPLDSFEIGSMLCDVIAIPLEQGGASIILSASIGFAPCGLEAVSSVNLAEFADFALYEAKEKSEPKVAVFDDEVRLHHRRRALLEQALKTAIKHKEFNVVFQPIYDVEKQIISSCEALARWKDKDLGVVRPDEFIQVAEQTGQISKLTEVLLYKAAREAVNWPLNISLSFNLSASMLADQTTGLRILAILARAGFAAHRLELEITETAAVSSFKAATEVIRSLKVAGVKIVLDDFGTGYASLAQLTAWPLDKVKIDKSLIDDITTRSKKQNMLEGVIDMIAALGLPCVAEGVETREQLDLLRKMQCSYVQGYLLARPSEHPFSDQNAGFPRAVSAG